jgi:hypothetical protein
MSDDILKSLEQLRANITSRKDARNQVEAEIKWNMQKLKELFDCDSLDEARGLLIVMMEEAEQKRQVLEVMYSDLIRDAREKGLI